MSAQLLPSGLEVVNHEDILGPLTRPCRQYQILGSCLRQHRSLLSNPGRLRHYPLRIDSEQSNGLASPGKPTLNRAGAAKRRSVIVGKSRHDRSLEEALRANGAAERLLQRQGAPAIACSLSEAPAPAGRSNPTRHADRHTATASQMRDEVVRRRMWFDAFRQEAEMIIVAAFRGDGPDRHSRPRGGRTIRVVPGALPGSQWPPQTPGPPAR